MDKFVIFDIFWRDKRKKECCYIERREGEKDEKEDKNTMNCIFKVESFITFCTWWLNLFRYYVIHSDNLKMHLRHDTPDLDYRGGEYIGEANRYSGGSMTWMIQYAWGEGGHLCQRNIMHYSM